MDARFANVHNDPNDTTNSMSGINPMHDLPEGYEGGRFHLMEEGIAIRLIFGEPFAARGIDSHFGTPALAPKGLNAGDIPKHLARVLTITYTSGPIAAGNVIMPLASLGNAKAPILDYIPEMRNIK